MAYYKGLILECLAALRKEASSAIRQRGSEIHRSGGVKLLSFDGEYYEAKFKVSSQSGGDSYEVEITDMDDPESVDSDCDCPSDYYPCKHAVAASFALEDHINQDFEKNKPSVQNLRQTIIDITEASRQAAQKKPEPPKLSMFKMSDTTLELKNLEDRNIQNRVSPNLWTSRRHYLQVRSVEQGKGYEAFEQYTKKYGTNRVVISRASKGIYHIACSCNQELRLPLCEHKMGVLVWLSQTRGPQALELLKNLFSR